MVDDRADYARLDRQLPDANRSLGRRADVAERPAHRRAAVFVDRRRVPGRDHAATPLRLCAGRDRAEARLCAVRRRVVAHQHFEYREREFSAAPYRSSLQADTLNSFQERTR